MIYSQEFIDISQKLSNFHFFPVCTAQKGHLNANIVEETVGSLKNYSILMCGPKKMTRELKDQFVKKGINSQKIIFEDFEFF